MDNNNVKYEALKSTTTSTYFLFAVVVDENGKKKTIRDRIIKENKNQALELAIEWQQEFKSWQNKIEVHVTEHIDIDTEIFNSNNKQTNEQ